MSVFFSLWLAFAAALPAAKLHKCVDARGTASYQNLPCAPGQRSEWVREVSAAAGVAPPSRARAAPARSASRAAPSRRRATPQRARERESGCEQARRHARDTRDRLWNRLTFQERSELDAEVARACRR